MSTKKILNKDVSNVVEESLTGYLMAYRKYYKKIGEYNAFKYRGHRKDKVAMVIGGGSVVVHDIPSDSLAVGNPARVIRRLAPRKEKNAPAEEAGKTE